MHRQVRPDRDVGLALLRAGLALSLFLRAARDHGDEGRGAGDFLWDFIERYERRREVPA